VAPLSGSTDKPEEQKPPAEENDAGTTVDLNIQIDAPDLPSFPDAPADNKKKVTLRNEPNKRLFNKPCDVELTT
jgi:hypothetical protein